MVVKKGHTYLNKPAGSICRCLSMHDILLLPVVKGFIPCKGSGQGFRLRHALMERNFGKCRVINGQILSKFLLVF